MIADLGYSVKSVWTEVTQADQRLGSGVFNDDAVCRSFVCDEYLVVGVFVKTNQIRRVQSQLADVAGTLDRDPAACPRIIEVAVAPRCSVNSRALNNC